MTRKQDAFGARRSMDSSLGAAVYFSLRKLEDQGLTKVDRLPFSIRVLLEGVLRNCDGFLVTEDHVKALAGWRGGGKQRGDIPFMPARAILQDFTGVPSVADLAAMREAMQSMGGKPGRINPLIPADLVIDHSVQVDFFGSADAYLRNVEKEYARNEERYAFLNWAQKAFDDFRVVPPGTGIVHQVNLEHLGRVVQLREEAGELTAFPDTLVGTDSHTTMINGLGILGWGVGGIEAEAVMLGQPYYMPIPDVVGFRLTGQLPEGSTATDLVLTVTQMLRKRGVVGKFVEFFGSGLSHLSLPDRATIGNMAPEYGATVGFFPVDAETLKYLQGTGRGDLVELVERYCKEQGMFRTDATPDPEYTDTMELDMSTVEPSLAGPRRPQDRVALGDMKTTFRHALLEHFGKEVPGSDGSGSWGTDGGMVPAAEGDGGAAVAVQTKEESGLEHGAVAIAAITSCTNTSNPSVMVGAGLLARKARERGLDVKPWVKTSMAPGSRVVTEYLQAAGLMEPLEALRFHVVGYGCTTCIGNSGTLPDDIATEVQEQDLVVSAVLSGNRNFEGRINPLVKANYLASPVLVVAYALAGTVDIDLRNDPLGHDPDGNPVYLQDIWPTQDEVSRTIEASLNPQMFQDRYAEVFEGDEKWQTMPVPEGDLFEWDAQSTYIQAPPFFADMPVTPPDVQDIDGARVLVMVGDSITTDHISPAGAIPKDSPAGRFLMERGVEVKDFNTFGARRGNHHVMVRGTFGNIRLRNQVAPGTEGGWTLHMPSGEQMYIYDAAVRYQEEGVPLLVLAGKEYGAGSSRDWAAKGTLLLGVRAVLAESYERIHRSNLVGMGVLPLQFRDGETRESLGLTGTEVFSIAGLREDLGAGKEVTVRAKKDDGSEVAFTAIARLDSAVEVEYYRNGGILQTVLRNMAKETA